MGFGPNLALQLRWPFFLVDPSWRSHSLNRTHLKWPPARQYIYIYIYTDLTAAKQQFNTKISTWLWFLDSNWTVEAQYRSVKVLKTPQVMSFNDQMRAKFHLWVHKVVSVFWCILQTYTQSDQPKMTSFHKKKLNKVLKMVSSMSVLMLSYSNPFRTCWC